MKDRKIKIFYNPHVDKIFVEDDTGKTITYLLGVGHFWFYIGDL